MSVYEIEKTIERIGAALADPNTKIETWKDGSDPPRRPRKADRELADRARELQSRDNQGPGGERRRAAFERVGTSMQTLKVSRGRQRVVMKMISSPIFDMGSGNFKKGMTIHRPVVQENLRATAPMAQSKEDERERM